MSHTIAIAGHSGLVGKPVVAALTKTDAKIKILYRKGSDISYLDPKIETTEINYDDEASITKALTGVDIFISLHGGEALSVQHKFIKPFKAAGVKLFVPSELGYDWNHKEAQVVGFLKVKLEVEEALKAANIPFVQIISGGFSGGFAFPPLFGVDSESSTVTAWGNADAPFHVSSLPFIGAVFASLFPSTPIQSLVGRRIGIYEVEVTANKLAAALEAKKGVKPTIKVVSPEEVKAHQKGLIANGEKNDLVLLGAALHVKIAEGTASVGNDVYEPSGYQKKTLEELLPF